MKIYFPKNKNVFEFNIRKCKVYLSSVFKIGEKRKYCINNYKYSSVVVYIYDIQKEENCLNACV